jgi:REP element-mobilizing transposase RayT
MPTGYQIYDGSGMYYLTFQIVQWADIFTRKRYRDIVCDSLNYCREHKGLRVHAYCIMSNHMHCILTAVNGNLSDVIRDCKAHTSRQMIQAVQQEPESRRKWLLMLFEYAAGGHNRNERYQLWTHENHAVELHSDAFFSQKLGYIHDNPVRAGWVLEGREWIYSSAADYVYDRQIGPVLVDRVY